MNFTPISELNQGDLVVLVGEQFKGDIGKFRLVSKNRCGDFFICIDTNCIFINESSYSVRLLNLDSAYESDKLKYKQSLKGIRIETSSLAYVPETLVKELVQNYLNYEGFKCKSPLTRSTNGDYSFEPEVEIKVKIIPSEIELE